MTFVTTPLRAAGGSSSDKRPVAVLGAGFSGTMAAIQLLCRLPDDEPVLLCERAVGFAQGLAYTSRDPDHLLNVRVANMSAFPDDPGHFERWLAAGADDVSHELRATEAGTFASRNLYGRYLKSILDDAMRKTVNAGRLRLLPDEIVDVVPDGDGFALHATGGGRYPAASVVLAMGNLPAADADDPRWFSNPWRASALENLEKDRAVLIVGTGLTMVDLAMSLVRRGFEGPIIAVSRGGLLPKAHAASVPRPTPELSAERGSVVALLRRVRAEIARAEAEGGSWRAVVDSIRPVTVELWRGLPPGERARFLRHLRRWWDVHRHRMATPNAVSVAAMQASGQLRVRAARIERVTGEADAIHVQLRGRDDRSETIAAQRVLAASGTAPVGRTEDTLVRRLLDRGLARLDPQALGIEVTDSLEVVDGTGQASQRLWALGPLVRGVFWECTAVPDIRSQAALVADRVAEARGSGDRRWSYAI